MKCIKDFKATLVVVLLVMLFLSPGVVQAAPYPPDSLTASYQAAAAYIDSQTTPTGYCVVFGAGEGRLAYELSLLDTGRRFVGIEDASASVDSGRTKLDGEGLYGRNISLHNDSLSASSHIDYTGAMILCDSVIAEGSLPGSAAEMFRLIRPDGGVAIIGQPTGCPNAMSQSALESWLGGISYTITNDSSGIWARIDRGALTGAGDWDHMWGNIGNTGCSEDTISGNSGLIQWWGAPGPRYMVDRHNRPMASLVKGGRLVIPGIDDVYCVDAYNGALLWTLANTGATRMAILKDAGNIALADDYAYIANGNGCRKVDMDTGSIDDTFTVTGRDWGYVGVTGDYLIGSEQINNASILSSQLDNSTWVNSYFGFSDVVTSKELFCINRNTGASIWTYDNSANGVIVNPTICAGDGYVYFVEFISTEAKNDNDGRVSIDSHWNQSKITKLDITNGNVVWSHQRDTHGAHIIYLMYKDSKLVLTSANGGVTANYNTFVYNVSDCSLIWSDMVDSGQGIGGSHGEQDKHSMIIGNVVYNKWASYNLSTGGNGGRTWATSNCADYSSSANYIYTRNGGQAYVYGTGSGGNALCEDMRTGCYISIIPAGGLTFLPPYATGCTCGPYALLTTVAWRP